MIKIYSNLSDRPAINALTENEVIKQIEQGSYVHLPNNTNDTEYMHIAHDWGSNIYLQSVTTFKAEGYNISNAPLININTIKALQLMLGNQ